MKQSLPDLFLHLCFLFLLFPFFGYTQNISGYIQNEDNEPIPYVNIYIQELDSGTATDENGYYFLNLDVGDYEVVFSALGYISETRNIIVGDEPVVENIWMKQSNLELNEIVVKAKKRDPAYEIIQKVIDNKKKYLTQISSSKSKVYIKAIEELDEKAKAKEKIVEVGLEGEGIDPFEAANKEDQELLGRLNMAEIEIILNYQYPQKYKEERIAYEKYGDQSGLFIPRFGETDFNFYKNLVPLPGITEVPIISPVSRTAILSYKYKLLEAIPENGRLVYKIKVTPRKAGNSTCSGFLYINDELWNINRLDLSFQKGGLKFYDKFQLKQDYEQIEDELWIVNRQEMIYSTRQGKRKTYNGSTLIRHSEFENNYQFPEKFFGNELAVTTKEAYERDTSYWKTARPEPLSKEQLEMVRLRDSIERYHNSAEYQDSLQREFNRITFLEVIYEGLGFRDYLKKQNIYLSSLASLVEFELIGGWRLGPYASYFRRYPNEKIFYINGTINIGLKNQDIQGNSDIFFRYDPFRLADINLRVGRVFQSINDFDAYLNQLSTANYILNDRLDISHRIELFNGFYASVRADYSNRQSLKGYDSKTFINNWINDDSEPIDFEDYQSFITDIRLSYTPKQRYLSEPNRKVVLGSKFPTFSVKYRKGWNGPFSSDIDFDYLDFTIEQDVIFGVLGNSKYTARVGKFFNSKDLRYVDLKRFRQSDPYLYSDPLRSFQLLDTSLVARDWFFEVHHIHHFNGALINNIPLVKKLRVRVVAGGGFLWIRESQYRHEEVFAGLERVFKIGKRRRLRLGIYGVIAESNKTGFDTGFKVSFDLIDTWKKDWSF
jgi:predicted transcriptional regulator